VEIGDDGVQMGQSYTRLAKICAVESFRVATRRMIFDVVKSADGSNVRSRRHENFDVVVGP